MEELHVRNGTTELHLPGSSVERLSTERVVETIQFHSLRGLTDEPLPETVRWRVDCGPLTVFILELKPELRWVRWLSPKSPEPLGPGAVYEDFRLATPFVVLKVPFHEGKVLPSCELFYSNQPLAAKGLASEVFWSNLLNVSPLAYGCTAWLCTQFLDKEIAKAAARSRRRPGMVAQLDAVVSHLWGGAFSRSSDVNEGASCFSKAAADGIDPRVTDVRRWQEASIADPRFVLSVAWKPTGLTVRDLIRGQLDAAQLPLDVAKVPELVNALLARWNGKEE
jgi:hypothetical protein